MPLIHVSDGVGQAIVFGGLIVVFLLCFLTRKKKDGDS